MYIRVACGFIFVAVILDMLDGYVARCLNVASEMGKQLDSFSDLVTFGIAPVAIFISLYNPVPWYITIILLIYPISGGYRLARYNLQEDSSYFTGLPITVSGLIQATVLMVNSFLHTEPVIIYMIFISISLILSVLMVGRFKVNRILKF